MILIYHTTGDFVVMNTKMITVKKVELSQDEFQRQTISIKHTNQTYVCIVHLITGMLSSSDKFVYSEHSSSDLFYLFT